MDPQASLPVWPVLVALGQPVAPQAQEPAQGPRPAQALGPAQAPEEEEVVVVADSPLAAAEHLRRPKQTGPGQKPCH